MDGLQKICFFNADESMEPLFISCPFELDSLHFHHYIPTSIANLFGNLLNGVDK